MEITWKAFTITSKKGDKNEKDENARSRWRLKHLRDEPSPVSNHPPSLTGHKSLEIVEIEIVKWPY